MELMFEFNTWNIHLLGVINPSKLHTGYPHRTSHQFLVRNTSVSTPIQKTCVHIISRPVPYWCGKGVHTSVELIRMMLTEYVGKRYTYPMITFRENVWLVLVRQKLWLEWKKSVTKDVQLRQYESWKIFPLIFFVHSSNLFGRSTTLSSIWT